MSTRRRWVEELFAATHALRWGVLVFALTFLTLLLVWPPS